MEPYLLPNRLPCGVMPPQLQCTPLTKGFGWERGPISGAKCPMKGAWIILTEVLKVPTRVIDRVRLWLSKQGRVECE